MSPAERPLYLDAPGRDAVFGVFHPAPDGAPPGPAVLLCPPFGWDDVASYRSRRAWAGRLAAGGVATLRIDLPGTGDSGGGATDPGRLAAWVAAVADAAAWLRSTGATRVVAAGLGLGGMVAAEAVVAGAPVDDLVLWAVPAGGKRLVREMRAFGRLEASAGGGDEEPPADGALHVAGFVLSPETVRDLTALDLTRSEIPGADGRRALLLERDGIGVDERLRAHLERSGVAVTVAAGPGYGDMLGHPQTSRPPLEVFATVDAWLRGGPADAPAATVDGDPPHASETTELSAGGARVRETALVLGERFAVLTEPVEGARAPLCAVFYNAGAVRRIGPNRMWVEVARRWAARGVPTLRLDMPGIGDAPGTARSYEDNASLHTEALVDHAASALDALAARGLPQRFVVGGLCSGAYWSFRVARRDPRIASVVLFNASLLRWQASRMAYREARALAQRLRMHPWRRVVRDELAGDALRRAVHWGLVTPARVAHFMATRAAVSRDVDGMLDRLRDGGTRATFVFSSGGEALLDEFEREGRLERLDRWPNLRLALAPGTDHTFRPVPVQHWIHALLDETLERELQEAGSEVPGSVPERATAEPGSVPDG